MKAKEVLSLLKITRVTLCSYVKKGIIKATRLPSGMYDYSKESVYNLLSKNGSRKTVIYARVSKSEATLLEEQISFVSKHMKDNGFSVDEVYKDIECDIDMNRPGLVSLISDSIAHNIGRIFLLSKSRLSSTSFSFFQSLFKDLGIEVYSIANESDVSLKSDAIENMAFLVEASKC